MRMWHNYNSAMHSNLYRQVLDDVRANKACEFFVCEGFH
eukprot:COSAG02_NODE_2210_length_9492_cov_22.862877_6_plen_39_part_00